MNVLGFICFICELFPVRFVFDANKSQPNVDVVYTTKMILVQKCHNRFTSIFALYIFYRNRTLCTCPVALFKMVDAFCYYRQQGCDPPISMAAHAYVLVRNL